MADMTQEFLSVSRVYLKDDYLPKIERTMALLSDDQIWHRENAASNSIGNLILHLTGSSRYWAVEVIGRRPIGRVRQREFDERGPIPRTQLLTGLRAAMGEVDGVLAGLSGGQLLESRTARDETATVLWCIYHIVEHFSMHSGQILSMAKAQVGDIAPAMDSSPTAKTPVTPSQRS